MPYTSDQLKMFGIALSMKRGKTPHKYSAEASKIAKSTSEAELKRMIGEGEKVQGVKKSRKRRIR